MKKYLAVDIGGTFVKHGLISEKGEILENGKIGTPKNLDSLLDLLTELSRSYQGFVGIAVSCPGSVSDEGIVYGTSAVKYLHNGDNIKQLIETRTGFPVFMENDANCAGYAELWNGNAKGKKDVLVMVIGSAIGGAIIKNGLIHKGAHLHGGEFGYMLLSTDVKNSDDVWSRRTSTRALVWKVAKLKNMKPEELSGEMIFEMAENGDSECIQAVDDFYHLLAIGIFNLQYIYDPEIILIGGGISAREGLIENINVKLDEIINKIDLAHVRPIINRCKFRQDANLLGAVYGFTVMEQNLG